jgi:hypothetical protein
MRIQTRLLDRCIGGITFQDLLAAEGPEASTEDVQAVLDELVSAELLTRSVTEDPLAVVYERPRALIVDARMRALGLATKDGTTTAALDDDFVTPKDLETLVEAGLLLVKGPMTEPARITLAVGAEERIWQVGARALCDRTVPPARPEPADALQAAILLALYATDDWTTAEDIQSAVNAANPGEEHVAIQVIEQALSTMFDALLVDLDAGPVKRWRESAERVIERRAAFLRHMLPGDGDAAVEDLLAALSVPNVALDQDVGAFADAGFLALENDRVELTREHGIPAVLVFVATEQVRRQRQVATPETIQASVQEVAAWREKHGAERRRADDLAGWLHKHGLAEIDVLNQVRGVVRPAVAKGEPFFFTESRKVDSAEKGVILGEILELENQVAQVRTELEGEVSTHKGKIKAIEAEIRDLKNAAACNQRVVSIEAYRRTDWDAGKVYVHAVDDDRELAVEDLPKGAQRTIPGTEAPAQLGPVGSAAVEKFAKAAEEKGWKVTLQAPGEAPVELKRPEEPAARADITTIERLDEVLGIVLAAHFMSRSAGITEAALIADLEKGYAIAVPTTSGAVWPVEKVVRASLGRLKRAGVADTLANGKEWVPGGKGKLTAAGPALAAAADAVPSSDEPGPLASAEQRADHAKKPRGRKAKAEATAP